MKLIAFAVVGSLLSMVGAASAGTLYSQPYDGTGNLYASQNDTSGGNGAFATAYDDFTLSSASQLNGFDFTGGYYNPGAPGAISDFTLTLYADNGGTPGAQIAFGVFTNFNESLNGNIATYALSFGNFALGAGTYWASVVPDMPFPPQWGWATSTVGNNNGYQCFFGTCSNLGVNFAFDVLGTSVPEPATWALMLVGFGGLGASLRSRRKSLATGA